MKLTLVELASVHGGLRWEQFRPSRNVEDRRDWSEEQHMTAPIRVPPPLGRIPLPPRRPRDLTVETVPLPPRRPRDL